MFVKTLADFERLVDDESSSRHKIIEQFEGVLTTIRDFGDAESTRRVWDLESCHDPRLHLEVTIQKRMKLHSDALKFHKGSTVRLFNLRTGRDISRNFPRANCNYDSRVEGISKNAIPEKILEAPSKRLTISEIPVPKAFDKRTQVYNVLLQCVRQVSDSVALWTDGSKVPRFGANGHQLDSDLDETVFPIRFWDMRMVFQTNEVYKIAAYFKFPSRGSRIGVLEGGVNDEPRVASEAEKNEFFTHLRKLRKNGSSTSQPASQNATPDVEVVRASSLNSTRSTPVSLKVEEDGYYEPAALKSRFSTQTQLPISPDSRAYTKQATEGQVVGVVSDMHCVSFDSQSEEEDGLDGESVVMVKDRRVQRPEQESQENLRVDETIQEIDDLSQEKQIWTEIFDFYEEKLLIALLETRSSSRAEALNYGQKLAIEMRAEAEKKLIAHQLSVKSNKRVAQTEIKETPQKLRKTSGESEKTVDEFLDRAIRMFKDMKETLHQPESAERTSN